MKKLKELPPYAVRFREYVQKNFKEQKDFADFIGRSPAQVNGWLQGRRAPRELSTIEHLEKKGVPIRWILFGDENAPKETASAIFWQARAAELEELLQRYRSMFSKEIIDLIENPKGNEHEG